MTEEDNVLEVFAEDFDEPDFSSELNAEFKSFIDKQKEVGEEAIDKDLEEEEEVDPMEEIYRVLKEKGINQQQLDSLKSRYGSLYLFAPSETDVYVWRPIYKKEWDAINNQIPKGQTPEEQTEIESKLEKFVIRKCVVYPRLDEQFIDNSRAGLLSTLFNVIMQGSYFFSPQQALSLVVEL